MPKLNEDILLGIMRMTDRRTHRVLMETCRLFYSAGAKRLLSREVTLRTSEQTQSFVMFMFGDCGRRFELLHTLRFGYYDTTPLRLSPHTACSLTSLFTWLAVVGKLCTLIIGSAEIFLSSNPGLLDAIAELESLRSLSIFNVGLRGATLLRRLKSRLVYVNIELSEEDQAEDSGEEDEILEGQDTDDDNEDSAALISHSADTLRELRTTPALSYDLDQAPVFPLLTRLTFFKFHVVEEYTGHYARMFPNLRELFVYDCDSDHRDFGTEEMIAQREGNLANQRELGRWPSLRLYEGGLPELYSLGLTCRIDWVKLPDEFNTFEPFMFMTVLQGARPIRLDLSMMGARWLLHDDVLSVFGMPAAERLTALTLEVLEVEDCDVDIHGVANNVVTKIVPLLNSLTEFELILNCGLLARDMPSLHSLDAEGIAARVWLANTSGSLRSISVVLVCACGRRWARFGPPVRDFFVAYEEEYRDDGEEGTRKMMKELRKYGDLC